MIDHIDITHTAPNIKKFIEWGVQKAYPKFYINIMFYGKEKKEVLSFRVEITGHYYCCGSSNFEDINIRLDSYNIHNLTKTQVSDILNDQNIIDNFKKSLEESIKDSMIPNDPIGILEQLWDEF